MASKQEGIAYKIFVEEMRESFGKVKKLIAYRLFINVRMKPYIVEFKQMEGEDVFFASIKNCVAGCRSKWKTMSKVNHIAIFLIAFNSNIFIV